ncbi:hypothetical protein EUX98_g8646 [Antrodiella citrinella]|uniref:Enoyl reductase (ER) domain-containing protein n=1 Tax=Antrodiella citrinella TaxID=2447956 RepID=A0A4S4M4T1_9APHY|nr:hypothetical protein EUX98_g8646 [Antrodiella citrinella]
MATASIPTTQQALWLKSAKGAWVIEPNAVPKPEKGEVLTRIESSALNPVDWKIHDYDFGVSEYPAIIGQDIAGVVVAVGEGVENVKVGDRVLHQGVLNKRQAGFQQYTIVPAGVVAKFPASLSFDEASTLPVGVATATVGLYSSNAVQSATLVAPWKTDGRGKYADQPILILGGSSAVGQSVIQFAKLSGFSPIITTVSPRNNDFVTSLGATHTIDRNEPLSSLSASVKAITTKPLTLVFDAVATAETQIAGYEVLHNEGGVLVVVLVANVPEADQVPGKRIAAPYGSAPHHGAFGEEVYAHLSAYLESGDVKPNQVDYVAGGLGSIPDALDKLRKNKSLIKIKFAEAAVGVETSRTTYDQTTVRVKAPMNEKFAKVIIA